MPLFLLPIFSVHGWCSITPDNGTRQIFFPLSQFTLLKVYVIRKENKCFMHLNVVSLISHLDMLIVFKFSIEIQHTALLSNIL